MKNDARSTEDLAGKATRRFLNLFFTPTSCAARGAGNVTRLMNGLPQHEVTGSEGRIAAEANL
jgi:hypothetical protein